MRMIVHDPPSTHEHLLGTQGRNIIPKKPLKDAYLTRVPLAMRKGKWLNIQNLIRTRFQRQ